MTTTLTPSAGLNAGFQDKQNGWGGAVNQNWLTLDLLSVPFVISSNVALPPDNPTNGDRYLVPANALGLWSDKGNQVAVWSDTQWLYYAPKNGWKFTSLTEKKTLIFNGTVWVIWVESLPPDVLAKIDAAIAAGTTAQAAAAQTTADKAAVTSMKQQTETARDIAATSATNAQQARSGAIAARDAAQQASIDAAAARDGARESEQTAMYAAQQLSSAVADTTANAQAAQTAAANAQSSATSALASWQSLDGRYLGGKATAPTTNNQGGALQEGMLYLNSTDHLLYVYANGTWNKTTPNSAIQVSTVIPTAGQTVFNTPAPFTPGSNTVDVWVNGVRVNIGTDYTEATNGTSITLAVPATVDDEVTISVIQTLAFGSTASNLVSHGSSTVKDALDAINLTDYAALRAYTGSARQVCITGYLVSAAPSQIAGDFVRDSSDTTSADNGATTIVSVDGTRWKRQASCSVQASWFGVRGDWDGVNGTDNWAALQAAILWAYQNSIGYVELGAGRHRISKPLYLYGSDNPTKAGVSLRGRGVRATTLERSGNSTTNDGSWYASVDSTLIMTPYPVPTSATPVTGTYNVGVSDMSISGNVAGTNTYGVYTKDSFGQIKFERVCILNTVNSFRTDADMWMSSFENISMHPASSGFWMNKSGTSIILKDAYVLGGGADGGVGFNLQALYSHAESVAVEGFTGTPFQFRFANFSVNGLGVECASATQPAVVVANSSSITVNNTLILCPNAFLVGSGCSLKVTNPQLGDEFAPTARAGYLWFVAGTGNLCIENLRAYDTYATANTGFALLSTAGTSGSGALGINKLEIKGNTSDNSEMAANVTNSSGVRLWGVRNDGVFWTGLAAASPYNNTSAGAANLGVDNNGILFRSTSSLKYKKNVQNAVHGLAEVMKLRSVTYSGKSEADGNKVFGGLIAEEVHDAGLTEFVVYADDGTPDALAYANMVSLLVKAIQELKVQVDALSNKQV